MMTKKLEVRTGELDVQYESIFGDEAKSIKVAEHQAASSVNAVLSAACWNRR